MRRQLGGSSAVLLPQCGGSAAEVALHRRRALRRAGALFLVAVPKPA